MTTPEAMSREEVRARVKELKDEMVRLSPSPENDRRVRDILIEIRDLMRDFKTP